MAKEPLQPQDKYVVRMPEGLRDRIKRAADTTGRSMNAEIVAALEEKFPAPIGDIGSLSVDELFRRFETAGPEERERIRAALGVFG